MAPPMTVPTSVKRHIIARSFLVPVFVFGLLALSLFLDDGGAHGQRRVALVRRDITIDRPNPASQSKDKNLEVSHRHYPHREHSEVDILKCRSVHNHEDQCAFIKANCPNEEAGLLSYLQLYYCRLNHAKPVAFIILTLWLAVLFSTIGIAASDFFCINLSTIAGLLGMSESMAGVTFLAFGNGSPDVFSTFAAMKTHSGSLAIGELIGAAGFITAVVAGSMALVRPFKVPRKTFVRDVGFFAVAASFSMVFLADGHLNLWECAVMIAFYVFYVAFVLVWHWYFGQRSKRKQIDATARGHFNTATSEDDITETYHDDDENAGPGNARTPIRVVSSDDFAALERGNSPLLGAIGDEEVDEEIREHYLAEISSNMRLSRPRPGERRNTINPIRPSLVGALEFNAVLSSLRKSRNIQTIPINLRRYSDDPSFTLAQQQERQQGISEPTYNNPNAHQVYMNRSHVSHSDSRQTANGNRIRAVSANDAANIQLDPAVLQRSQAPEIDLLEPSPPDTSHLSKSQDGLKPEAARRGSADLRSLNSRSEFGYFAQSPGAMTPIDGRPPSIMLLQPEEGPSMQPPSRRDTGSSRNSLYPPDDAHLSKITIPHSSRATASSPIAPFPEYHDDPSFRRSSRTPSIRLPPPSVGSESTAHLGRFEDDDATQRPILWWPNRFLPPPQTLLSTLFPTLYSWSKKNSWERLLGLVAAPSIFLLTITLPVVEMSEDDEAELAPEVALLSPNDEYARQSDARITILPPDSSSSALIDEHTGQRTASPSGAKPAHTSEHHGSTSSPKDWNRWLVATQLILAPLFITLLLYANGMISPVRPVLISLLISMVLLATLLLTSDPNRPPRYRPALTFLGFLVSIAWISTIAGEVVGVLKSLGVILQISDAILGLTVFAVGNSLGDLVADITVAKLGYPVMALSACFGGPMLNILLGIGVSGLFMTITGGQKWSERHPGKPVIYKPYAIRVSPSLVISGITLLVTLLGLLIFVPMNKWIMGKRVGWSLIALWVISTVGNLIVEVGGWARDIA